MQHYPSKSSSQLVQVTAGSQIDQSLCNIVIRTTGNHKVYPIHDVNPEDSSEPCRGATPNAVKRVTTVSPDTLFPAFW